MRPTPPLAAACLAVVLAFAGVGCAGAARPGFTGPGKAAGEGVASYYAARYHGRPTASGERFDMHAMTAAHKTLPFGTWVRVTHAQTGRSVVVRINDRGPFVRGRVIDLSYAAARELGIVEAGLAPVRLDVLRATRTAAVDP